MASVVARRTQASTANILRHSRSERNAGGSQLTRVLLLNLPRTALPTDVRRLCAKQKADHVAEVALDYDRFQPNGRAWLTVTQPIHTSTTVRTLQRSTLGGFTIRPVAAEPLGDRPLRSRGAKGRLEAAERGIITGMGPNGSVAHQGRCVVLSGLPFKTTAEDMKFYLKSFKLAGTSNGEMEIVKLDAENADRVSLSSRYFIRAASVAEAHRIVRRVHMTFYRPAIHNAQYRIHARVMY